MAQKMKRKLTLLFALSCIFSLGIGVLLGYGIQTQGLMGTVIPPGIGDNNSNDALSMVLATFSKQNNTLDRLFQEKMLLIDSTNKKIEEITQAKNGIFDEFVGVATWEEFSVWFDNKWGEEPEDLDSLFHKQLVLMREFEDLTNKRNAYMKLLADVLAGTMKAEDAIIRLQQ